MLKDQSLTRPYGELDVNRWPVMNLETHQSLKTPSLIPEVIAYQGLRVAFGGGGFS